jgi:hypothetical protein
MPYLPCHYPYISFIYCTCRVPTISVLNLVVFPCYSNLLLRRWRWIGILRRGVLGYALPRLPILWCYGVFRYFVPLRVILVFRDIIHIIIILYSWHLVICEHFWLYVWNNCFWVMHTMSTWFWHKTGYDTGGCITGAEMSAFFKVWNDWRNSSVKMNGLSLARRCVSGRAIWE